MATHRAMVRMHRDRLRRQGLRPLRIWVLDVRTPEFERQAHQQSAAAAVSEHEQDDQAFVDAVSSNWANDDSEKG